MFQSLKSLADGVGEGGEIFLSRNDAESLAKAAKRVKNSKLTKKTMRAENGGFIVPCGLLREIVRQCAGLEMDAEDAADPQDNPAPDAEDSETVDDAAERLDAGDIHTTASELANVSAADAINAISRMRSVDRLTHIADNDKRVSVRDAAQKRLAAL